MDKKPKFIKKSDLNKSAPESHNNKLLIAADELVTTTYTREERAMVRWLKASIVEKLTGIKRYNVQDFINGRSMSKSKVIQLARIIEVLKQL